MSLKESFIGWEDISVNFKSEIISSQVKRENYEFNFGEMLELHKQLTCELQSYFEPPGISSGIDDTNCLVFILKTVKGDIKLAMSIDYSCCELLSYTINEDEILGNLEYKCNFSGTVTGIDITNEIKTTEKSYSRSRERNMVYGAVVTTIHIENKEDIIIIMKNRVNSSHCAHMVFIELPEHDKKTWII
jgi:hypothetical protein